MITLLTRHRRIATETAWVFAGQGISGLATLIGLRVITEMVPPDIYGAVTLALGVVMLAHGLAVGPMMQAVLRFYPDHAREGGEARLRRAAAHALRRPILVALLVLAVAGLGWMAVNPRDVWLVLMSLALFMVEVGRSVEVTFLNAARRQRAMALFVAADAWLRPCMAVVLVWTFGASSAAVVGGYFAGCLIALAGLRVAKGRSLPTADHGVGELATPEPRVIRRLWAYALPLTALPLIGWVSGQADRYLLGGMVGVSAAGLYAALYGLASKPFLLLSASIEIALRQPYYACVSADDAQGARRILTLWLVAVVAGSAVLWLAFLFFHAEIASLVLAAEYRAHSALMGWIAAGYVLLAAAQVMERVCYAHHDTRGVVWIQAAGAALSVIVAAPLIYRYGIEGAAWAVPVYFGAQLLIASVRARGVRRRAASPVTSMTNNEAPVPTVR
ncbi:MAG: oligosaccharide flippase family protein [Hydrogenophilus sp.]